MKYAESPCANLPGNPAPMSVRVASEEQWSVRVHHRFRTDMLHPPLPISAEPVKAQTVLCLVDLVEKSRSQFRPLRGINLTRSEERRVGKECVSTCRSRWSPYH